MKVHRICPPQPKATFDIMGLTEDEYRTIRAAMIYAASGWENLHPSYSMPPKIVLSLLPTVEDLSRG